MAPNEIMMLQSINFKPLLIILPIGILILSWSNPVAAHFSRPIFDTGSNGLFGGSYGGGLNFESLENTFSGEESGSSSTSTSSSSDSYGSSENYNSHTSYGDSPSDFSYSNREIVIHDTESSLDSVINSRDGQPGADRLENEMSRRVSYGDFERVGNSEDEDYHSGIGNNYGHFKYQYPTSGHGCRYRSLSRSAVMVHGLDSDKDTEESIIDEENSGIGKSLGEPFTPRNINVNVLSNLPFLDIIRAYRGLPPGE